MSLCRLQSSETIRNDKHTFRVVSEIVFGGSQHDRSVRAVLLDLRIPFGPDVLESGWRDTRIAVDEVRFVSLVSEE